MCRLRIWFIAVIIVGVLSQQSHLSADQKEEESLRSISGKYQDTVLTVKYVLKISSSFGAQLGIPEEQKGDMSGSVIDPSGLLVVSNSELRGPASFLDMMDIPPGMEGKLNIDVVPLDFKVVMPNGTEVPAKLIAQDSDLDLAFLRLDSKEKIELKAIPLAKGVSPTIGEIVVALGRLSENLNREPLAYHAQVISLVNKPRKMFMVAGLGNMGCPVFNLDGKALGIILMRPTSVKRNPMMFMNASADPLELMPMVLPAEEILDAVSKLPPASPAEEKPAE